MQQLTYCFKLIFKHFDLEGKYLSTASMIHVLLKTQTYDLFKYMVHRRRVKFIHTIDKEKLDNFKQLVFK